MIEPHAERWLRRSLELAEEAVLAGDEPFGALVVQDGRIVSEASSEVRRTRDWTRHAELVALSRAMRTAGEQGLEGATLVSSTEPCPMCAGASYWSGVTAVLYGCSTEAMAKVTNGSLILPCRQVLKAGKRAVVVRGPLLEDEALQIHFDYWKQSCLGSGKGEAP